MKAEATEAKKESMAWVLFEVTGVMVAFIGPGERPRLVPEAADRSRDQDRLSVPNGTSRPLSRRR